MTDKKPTTPETLMEGIFADSPAESTVQEVAPVPCNLESEEFKKALGEKALELLNGGRRIVNVDDLPKLPGYTCFTLGALRHIIFNGTPRVDENGYPLPTNGLDKHGAIIRLGKGRTEEGHKRSRVLIDLNAFDKWIDDHREWPIKPPPAMPKK